MKVYRSGQLRAVLQTLLDCSLPPALVSIDKGDNGSRQFYSSNIWCAIRFLPLTYSNLTHVYCTGHEWKWSETEPYQFILYGSCRIIHRWIYGKMLWLVLDWKSPPRPPCTFVGISISPAKEKYQFCWEPGWLLWEGCVCVCLNNFWVQDVAWQQH